MKALGHVFKYGDNVDTDVIIPARYLNSFDGKELASHAMVDIDPEFAKKVKPGDMIVANKNFGCGSSREHAALVPNYLKIKAIFALSFARIHRSNLINNGILPLIIDQVGYDFFNDQDEYVLLDVKDAVENGTDVTVQNINTKETIVANSFKK